MTMKNTIKTVIVLLLLIQFPIVMFAQSQDQQNMNKYWYYRDRSKYFVIPGSKIGETEVASVRNRMIANTLPHSYMSIDFGQHSCYFGYYLGILATEYSLLIKNGRVHDANCDFQEASLALTQFINYMDACEHYFDNCNQNVKHN